MAWTAAKRDVRLSSGYGSAGPPGSGFELIRTGWRALSVRFPGRPLRRQRQVPTRRRIHAVYAISTISGEVNYSQIKIIYEQFKLYYLLFSIIII